MKFIATLILLVIGNTAMAQTTDAEYNAMVDEVLEITGALDIGKQMGELIVTQMSNALKASATDLPDEAYDALADEVNKTLVRSIKSGEFQALMYPVYAKHLSKDDLRAMIAFYKTPAGARIAKATPLMAQEGMLVGQQWGQSIGAEIGQRVMQRLEAEGYELP